MCFYKGILVKDCFGHVVFEVNFALIAILFPQINNGEGILLNQRPEDNNHPQLKANQDTIYRKKISYTQQQLIRYLCSIVW